MGTVLAKEGPPRPVSTPHVISQPSTCGPNESGKTVNYEGLEARVDKVHIDGLSRTKDDIIIESVQDLFQTTDFEELFSSVYNVQQRLQNLGCFRNIGVQLDTSSGPDSSANGVEVTFYVKELERLTTGVNSVIGTNEGSLVVSLMAPNIFGRGERVQVEYSHGSRQTSNLSLTCTKPLRTKYDAKFSSSLFQHCSEWPWSGYRCIERGLLFDLSFFSSCMVKHNLQYEAAWREMGTLSKTSSMSVREQSGHTLKSALRHILTVDKRDALFFPTKGSLFRFTTELAGIGGDVSFLKNEFYWQYNIPLYQDIVLQTTLTGGILTSPFRDELSAGLPDKFYTGGPMSVRGFQMRGIGPRSDGDAIGANMMWGAGLHLFTPLPFRSGRKGAADLFRIHFFTTLGQCKEISFSGDTGETAKKFLDGYRLSSGLGLALRLGQMAQVELNYVFPLLYSRDDVTQPGLQFGIGLQFL